MKQLTIMWLFATSMCWPVIASEAMLRFSTRLLSDEEAESVRGQGPYWPCQTFSLLTSCPAHDSYFDHTVCASTPIGQCHTASGRCPICNGMISDQKCVGASIGWDGCEVKTEEDGCGVFYSPLAKWCHPDAAGTGCQCSGVETNIRCPWKYVLLENPGCGGS